jgi:hypothetical protein
MMKKAATLLLLTVFIPFSAIEMAASTAPTLPIKAPPISKIDSAAAKVAPPNTVLNFSVSDVKGVLLKCAKQEVDTDTFSGCTLAPGRTLDDLMTSIIRAIRAEQQKDKAEEK